MPQLLEELIRLWRDDAGGAYHSWFLWDERIKNFGGIRRGLRQVVQEIEGDTFGNLYKGSSLETVVKSVAEQRQVFKGADHAFLWKPKLRIPDIYENRANQVAFGRFLKSVLASDREAQVLDAIAELDAVRIKGLGPAVANLLYFLHPTVAAPCNTAILRGFNQLTGATLKLGSWRDYLSMRQGVLELNARHQGLLSNDLGALAGLLFDIGSGRYQIANNRPEEGWQLDLAVVTKMAADQLRRDDSNSDISHSDVQGWLLEIGRSLGFETWVAANDRAKPCNGACLGDLSLKQLPTELQPGAEAVSFIDVIWFEKQTGRVAAAFEVEHTTSIYSGVVRLLDVSGSLECCEGASFYLVAPDSRAADVVAQLNRPAFRHVPRHQFRYLAYGELVRNREHVLRFGSGLKAIEALAKAVCQPG